MHTGRVQRFLRLDRQPPRPFGDLVILDRDKRCEPVNSALLPRKFENHARLHSSSSPWKCILTWCRSRATKVGSSDHGRLLLPAGFRRAERVSTPSLEAWHSGTVSR